ncbi:hypothetical protein VU04_02865 [Desulfobulbus sp. TB]|nr:hypothetical protein [Desulfobulbus sp. TB]
MHISKKILSVPVVISGSMNRPPSLKALFFTVFFTVLSVLSLSFTQQAEAHKLNIFCWTSDQQIYGETFFSGGRKAKNVSVHVQDAKSLSQLLTTTTDQKGRFQFVPPQQAIAQKLDLLISVNTGDGHRGEWFLAAGEYLLATSEASASSAPSEVSNAASSLQATEQLHIDMESMRAIIQQEVDKKLLPVKRKLAEAQREKPSVQNILVGISCIIGLTGILAWFQEKKKNTSING